MGYSFTQHSLIYHILHLLWFLDWYSRSEASFWEKEALKFLKSLFISAESADISSYTIWVTLSLVSKIGSQREGHQGWQESKHGNKCLGKERHCRETTVVGRLSTLRREVLHPASRTMKWNLIVGVLTFFLLKFAVPDVVCGIIISSVKTLL